MRVVIAHDFAETYGGAERIIAELCDLYPEAPFWAILGRSDVAERMGIADRFHTVLPARERLLRDYRLLAPAFPAIVRGHRLPAADVLITSSYAFAHGFRTINDAPQVCYCYSPLRFAWSQTGAYGQEIGGGPLGRRAFGGFAAAMRAIDKRAARHVTRYVTEAPFTADQIERFYNRKAQVVGPPVDCDLFTPDPEGGHDGYFLFCGRLVEAYKRPSLAVEAFRSLPDQRLLVAGDGPALGRLRDIAPPNVEFLGALGDRDLVGVMRRCAAGIFPSQDDFGLIPVELAACGRPALAYAAGGALHTVRPGVTGEFFEEQSVAAIVQAVRAFDPERYAPAVIRTHAEQWDRRRFREAMVRIVRETAEAGR